jgi:membrane-bound lytic murein transglycosylase B
VVAVYLAVLVMMSAGIVVAAHALVPTPDTDGAIPPGGAPYAAVPAPVAAVVQPPAPTSSDGLPVVDPAWLARTARRSGVPQTALTAYARASLRAPGSCHLGWTTLAAIGWVESHHGTIGKRVLDLDGTSSTPIVGPALDGSGGFGAIPTTETGTRLHGDNRWDHAVGPMQFITSTWLQWGADGDGDGVVDPQDVDDAAWAAARYLCADGRDLSDGSGWSGGIFSYNHSQAYLDSIYAAASAYAERTEHTQRTQRSSR